jgi:hypothetical protein
LYYYLQHHCEGVPAKARGHLFFRTQLDLVRYKKREG